MLGIEVGLAGRGPHGNRRHAVLGERAGLIGAYHVRGTEGLHRGESFYQRATTRQIPHRHRQREGDHRQQSLRHHAGQQPGCEYQRVDQGQMGARVATGMNDNPSITDTAAISQAARLT